MKTDEHRSDNRIVMGLVLALLTGCGPNTTADQCMRREIFKQCAEATKDAAQCERTAYYQSLRAREHIKPECRPS